MRLADREGKAMSWQRVKEIAFDEQASVEHIERQRSAAAPAIYLSEQAVFFSLRLVAKRLDLKSLTPGEYEDERLALLKEEKKRDLPRPLAAQLLPTVGQIEQLFARADDDEDEQGEGAWDQALAVAELEPRAQLRAERQRRGRREDSLPVIEAIHLFTELNGKLPSREDFAEFGERADIQIETARRPWRGLLKETIAYRRTLGLTQPTEMPKPSGGAGGSSPRAPVKAPAPGSIPGVARRLGKGQTRYTRHEPLTAIRAYLEQLKSGKPTQKGYGRYAVRNGLPSASNFEKHGGWRELVEEARALQAEVGAP
jgi:hypothetical protein